MFWIGIGIGVGAVATICLMGVAYFIFLWILGGGGKT